MSSEEKFEVEYKRLNPAQKKAVDAVEGTVMVVAGPGTGKTQILSLRIANILRKTDTNPENILALTYTNAGVFAMRKRLSEIIGPDAFGVNIFTFHGFCESLVAEHGEEYQYLTGSKLISPVEQLQIIEKIIQEGSFKLLKPWGDASYYVPHIPSALGKLKQEAFTPEKLDEVLTKQEKDFAKIEDLYHTKGKWAGKMKTTYQKDQKNIEKNKELAILYAEYQKILRQKKLYDYDDVILETVALLENNLDFLRSLQEKFQYILVDEHQDTNNSQNRILELLTDFFERPNLFVVGDEKQAIYRFQGASLENFMFFKNKYKDVLSVNLLENYRSTQNILDGAGSLIATNPNSDFVRLKSCAKNSGAKISVYPFSTPDLELAFVARDIQAKIKAGTKMNEIAVFYRNNNEVAEIARALEKIAVPFVIESKQNILAEPDIFKLMLLLKTVHYFGNSAWLGQTLYIDFLKIDSLDIYKLLVFSQKEKKNLFECLSSKKILEEARVATPDKLTDFYVKLEGWKKSATNTGLLSCLEEIIYQSGYFDYLLRAGDSADKLQKLNKFFDEAKKLARENQNFKLADFVRYLELLENYNLSIQTGNNDLFDGVRLMTAHGAKGLEFDIVYIINATDKHWGNKTARNKFKLPFAQIEQNNEDERRLFFVALTRARQEINLSYAQSKIDGRAQMPSRFLTEIAPEFINTQAVSQIEKDFLKSADWLVGAPTQSQASLKNKIYLNKLFLSRGLNATAVNNYLECPWKYFFNNLIKTPTGYIKVLAYGTIIHHSLEEFFENVRQKKKTTKKILLDIFRKNLEKALLPENDKQEAHIKGEKSLSGYYDKYHKNWQTNILNELKIKGIPVRLDKNTQILLSGKLDVIEILEGNQVRVVDYKTGKIQTRNKLEGKTRDANSNQHRQLVFYKLLLNQYKNKQYRMVEGEIDFVEPSDKGEYTKERFEISDQEANELEQTIKKIAREILDLSFWNTACDNKDCQFCQLRKIMGA